MDPNDTMAAPDAAADQTHSPSVTEGASSSEAVDTAPESAADAIRQEFMEKWGEAEPEETGDAPEEAEIEAAEEGTDGAEDQAETPKDAEDTQESKDELSAADTDDGEDDQFRIPDDQFKTLPDGVKKRLGHLNTRAKKAERELSEVNERIQPLEEKGSRFDELQTFVQTNDIEPENVTVAFNAMAKMATGDFQGFLDLVQPWYQQAQLAVGAAVAPDLQQRVDDGYLTEEDAREMSKARVKAEVSEGRVTALTERQKQLDDQSNAEGQMQKVLQAINVREAHFKSSDPDYALKSAAIASMMEFAIRSGNVPKTQQEAVEMVNDAHERVTSSFVQPKPKPKPTPPSASSSNPTRGVPKPENARDAMMLGLRSFQT